MNKKFFSLLLMGALTVATVGTVSSCKDYDDDINNLQEQIDELAQTVEGIQTQINAGSILKSVTSDGNGGVNIVVTKNGSDQTYNIAAGAAGAAGKDADVWTIGTDGYWYKNDAKTSYYALGTPGATGAAGKYYVPNAETGTFWVYGDGDKAAYDSEIVYTAPDAVTAVWDEDCLTLTNVSGAAGKKVVINLSSALKALVCDPAFYYQGIEAFDIATFNYTPKTVAEVNADGDFSKDAPTEGASVFAFSPDMTATYFLNPSNAKMSADASKYSFVAYNKETRAAQALTNAFTVKSADLTTTKGKVTVHAAYGSEAIKEIGTDKMVTVIALQYTTGDSIITSDFAAVKASIYKDLVLNNPKAADQTDGKAHLQTTAAKAIEEGAEINVTWNSEGIDLRPYVNTHRKYTGAANPDECTAWDKDATESVVTDYGFKYLFELVGYQSGTTKTSQSAHAALASDGYTLRPQMPAATGKQQAYGAEQGRASIGREPLVRVILKDTVNNQIAAVGYIKVKITDGDQEAKEVAMSAATDSYTIACTGNALEQNITWAEIETKVMHEGLNLSKDQFDDTYEIDYQTSADDLYQFAEATENAQALTGTTKTGTVAQVTVTGETNTHGLTWTITNEEAYSKLKGGATSLTTYVRYKLKQGKSGPHPYVYVKLTWTPEAINITPETSFSDNSKIKSYWYAADNAAAGSGYADMHGNVEVVGETGANDEYKFDLKSVLVGNKLQVEELAAPYAALNSNMTLTFAFQTGKGLYADATGANLYSTEAGATAKTADDLVASVTTAGVVEFAKTDVAKKLLNKVGHDDLVNTVTAVVAVKAAFCGVNVPVSNNTFNVKFLRPINVTGSTASFVDATTGGATSEVQMTFTDWRDHDFTDKDITKDHNYFAYYKVTGISVDVDNATTDINGKDTDKLKDVAPNIKFTYEAPTNADKTKDASADVYYIKEGKYGTLTYENSGVTVGTFRVYLPAKITYEWGTLETTIVATISKTQSN